MKFSNIFKHVFSNLTYFIYNLFSKLKNYREVKIDLKENKDINIAFICDQMTWDNYSYLCNAAYITPQNYKATFESFKPDILFCESAWHGIEGFKEAWRSKIYKNKNLVFDNRKDLIKILKHCNDNSIKTVFWNKEDPTFFDSITHSFVDTALLFDHVFTSSQECVSKYKNLGKQHVNTLPFGFAPWIFNPLNRAESGDLAVFAGAWYDYLPKRCEDTIKAFDIVLKNKLSLKIYDRDLSDLNKFSNFPKEYSKYVNPAVKYINLGRIFKNAALCININTSTKSDTMFARRAYEIMACATPLLSNESQGLMNEFGDNIAYIENENFKMPSQQQVYENLVSVFINNSVIKCFNKVLNKALSIKPTTESLTVFYNDDIIKTNNYNYIIVNSIEELREKANDISTEYVVYLNDNSINLEFCLSQFFFLPKDIAVYQNNKDRFKITTSTSINNIVFTANMFKNMLNDDINQIKIYNA